MHDNLDADLIVVGAGILGLSAAIQAAQQQMKVIVLEKDATAVGATRRNFGMVGASTLTRPDDVWRQYVLDTLDFYQQIQSQFDISFQQRAGVYLANSALEYAVLQEFAALAADHSIAAELLSAEQLAQQYRYLAPQQQFQGGLRCAQDYSVEPELIGARLLEYAQHLGVRVLTSACVVETVSKAGRVKLKLAQGAEYQANKVMICHGDTVNLLYPQLLQRLGLKRCALQMSLTEKFAPTLDAALYSGLSIARYPAFAICPSYAQLQAQPQQPLVKEFGIHVLLKQNQRGELLLGDSHIYTDIAEAAEFAQHEQVNDFIYDYCQKNMGIDLPPIQKRWLGFYLSHEQQAACVTEAEPNIYLVSAIAGKGMTTGAGFMKHVLHKHIF